MTPRPPATFHVKVEGRPTFHTHSHLLMRGYGDLHPFPGATDVTADPGQAYPRIMTWEHSEHRALRRAALKWNQCYHAAEKLRQEIERLPEALPDLNRMDIHLRELRATLLRSIVAANLASACVPADARVSTS